MLEQLLGTAAAGSVVAAPGRPPFLCCCDSCHTSSFKLEAVRVYHGCRWLPPVAAGEVHFAHAIDTTSCGCQRRIAVVGSQQVSRPLFGTFQHDRCRARKLLVGHRPVAIFRTAIWLLSGVTHSSSLGDLFCWRYGDWTESVPVLSRTPSEHLVNPY